MQVLWKLGDGFLKDIIKEAPEPKPHSNTIGTILRILIEKGFVESEQKGRINHYHPKLSKLEYGKKSVNSLIKSYFEGSTFKLVTQLVSDNKLSLQDLEELLKQTKPQKNPENQVPR
jgi:BlaI family penicillinase repressor